MVMTKTYAIGIDCETGGLDPEKHALLSIGYALVDKSFRVISCGEFFVKANPKRVIPAALQVNGIDMKTHNLRAQHKKTVARTLQNILTHHFGDKPAKIFGQNVPFDVSFLNKLSVDTGYKFNFDYGYIDTQAFTRVLEALGELPVENCKLTTLCKYFKIRIGKAHTGLSDILRTAALLRKFKRSLPSL